MNSKIVFLLLICCCIAILDLNAQRKKKKNDVEVIEFGNDDSSSFSADNTPNYSEYIIKTSPSSFIAGSQPIELEKYINDYLSVQAGIGLTFEPLVNLSYAELIELAEAEETLFCDSDIWLEDICDDHFETDYRRQKIGFMISGSARLYFDEDAMDGSYFALNLRYSQANIQINDITPNSFNINRNPNQWVDEKATRFDIVGHYGYQFIHSKLTSEYFIGLGARIRNQDKQDLGFNQFGFVQSAINNFKDSILRVELGLRIGFQL